MTDAPERIWAWHYDHQEPVWAEHHVEGSTEYIRADLHGWQPIETAPRDGSRFWGKFDDDAISMLWHEEFNAFVSSWRRMTFAPAYGGGSRDHSPDIHNPTHWMPQPEPPK